jgi:hypothetical protein
MNNSFRDLSELLVSFWQGFGFPRSEGFEIDVTAGMPMDTRRITSQGMPMSVEVTLGERNYPSILPGTVDSLGRFRKRRSLRFGIGVEKGVPSRAMRMDNFDPVAIFFF